MAEYIPADKVLLSVNIDHDQCVVSYDDDSNTVPNERNRYYFTCLETFESAFRRISDKQYEKNLISQLLLSNNRLLLCLSNRQIKDLNSEIEDLKLNLELLRPKVVACKCITGTECADEAQGESLVSNIRILTIYPFIITHDNTCRTLPRKYYCRLKCDNAIKFITIM